MKKKPKQKEFITPVTVVIQGEVKISAKNKKEAINKAAHLFCTNKPETIHSPTTRVNVIF